MTCVTLTHTLFVFYSILGFSNLKQISISSNVSNTAVGKSVELTCFARFGSGDSSKSTVQYLWSRPATNDNWSNRILHSITYSFLMLESISVLLLYIIHPSLLVFQLFFNVSKHYCTTNEATQENYVYLYVRDVDILRQY